MSKVTRWLVGVLGFAVLLCTAGCPPVLRYDGMLYELRKMEADARWLAVERIKREQTDPSWRLSDVAARGDHISQIQALLILAKIPWKRGVLTRILGLIKQSKDALVRAAAVRALEHTDRRSFRVQVVLREVLRDRAWQVRRMAFNALLSFHLPDQERVSLCKTLLKDPHPANRWEAILCWRQVAGGNAWGARTLMPLLIDPSARVQRQALQALGWWGHSAIPVLQQALTHGTEAMRCQVLAVLGMFRSYYPQIVPFLHSALRKGAGSVPACAVRALGQLAPHTELVAPALTEALRHPQRSVALDAIAALQQMGKHARPAIPIMLSIAQDSKKALFLRYAAVNAIRFLVSDKTSNTWKVATAIHQVLYKRVQESLFSGATDLVDATTLVTISQLWGVGIPEKEYADHIEKEYIPELRICNMNLETQKKRAYWVELFLGRRGQVILPFVFHTDKKTPIFDSCVNHSIWAWKFPSLRSNPYAYLQFKIQFSQPDDDDLDLGPSGGSSLDSGPIK